MKLYEIAESYKNLLEVLENTEEDEELQELVKKSMEEIEGDLTEKCKNICMIIKNYEADIKAYKEEEKRLAANRKRLEKSLDNLKDYLFTSLKYSGVTKVNAGTFKLAVRKNPAKLVVEDESKISEDYKIIRFDIDKTALKNDIKAGKEIEGCKLVQGESLSIK